MVTETKDNLNKMFETMNENLGAAFDAGVQVQRVWTDAVGNCFKTDAGCGPVFPAFEKSAKQLGPFVSKNVETMTELFETSARTGMDSFKAACGVVKNFNADDVGEKSREAFDTTSEAARKTFDAFTRAGQRTAENWSAFCTASYDKNVGSRTAAKPTK
jgi:hypothetical protein